MPLSTTIPFSLTRRISRRLRSISYNNVFIKYTVDEVINSYLNKEIIKKVPKKIRHYFLLENKPRFRY